MRGRILSIRDVHRPLSPARLLPVLFVLFPCKPIRPSQLCPGCPLTVILSFQVVLSLLPCLFPAVVVVRICYVLERSLGVSPLHCESHGCGPQRMCQSGLILSRMPRKTFSNLLGVWFSFLVTLSFMSYRDRKSSHPHVHFPSTRKAQGHGWGAGDSGLPHGWQEPIFLSHHHCPPWCVSAVNWTQKPEPGIEPRRSDVGSW